MGEAMKGNRARVSGNRARVSEVMGVSIDDSLEGDEEEQETLTRSLVNAPSGAVAAPVAKNKVVQVEAAGAWDGGRIFSDLQARLDNLRKK
ncbi:unnamed protein product [Eruca vesicaria subsp. sativa]|uniref:Uncharacterized protein n=1 Tax=Eruca vesicaria subsp. sativa TaxID=29727 RepID=A0ABC8M163_ERUVS|nr:unnamed protein product [Eruca vesicaria subsp. sativa]